MSNIKVTLYDEKAVELNKTVNPDKEYPMFPVGIIVFNIAHIVSFHYDIPNRIALITTSNATTETHHRLRPFQKIKVEAGKVESIKNSYETHLEQTIVSEPISVTIYNDDEITDAFNKLYPGIPFNGFILSDEYDARMKKIHEELKAKAEAEKEASESGLIQPNGEPLNQSNVSKLVAVDGTPLT